MPELPEVETVKLGFKKSLPKNSRIQKLWLSPYSLRFPYEKDLAKRLKSQKILRIFRRAKYLIFELEKELLVSHLGMSGTWREGPRNKKHDHIEITFSKDIFYTFNDPRRFGSLHLLNKKDWQKHALFYHLGPEPLSKDWNKDYLFQKTRKKQVAIKNFLMDQKNVVGVGNIYANEALFFAGVRPTKRAFRISKKEASLLVESTKEILEEAIKLGGSYIRDFQNLEGASQFQQKLMVYGKKEKPCQKCHSRIQQIVLLNRSTYYCPQCQK